jgi:uncharacterized RDD family membrane protein YckC
MTDRDLQQKRYIAAGIDIAVYIAIGIVFSILSMIMAFVFSSATSSSMVGTYLGYTITFIGSLVTLVYTLGRDVIAGDRSIGKKVQNIRVVTAKGAPIGPVESAKRNGIFALGAFLFVVYATLQLIPILGRLLACLLVPLLILGGLISLAAAIYELLQITQRGDGVRFGDQIAGTRVVR